MPLDHGLLDRAQETSDDPWEQKPGTCPLSDDVVAEESPPHITGDGRDDDVLPAAVVPGRTEDEDWADLSSGLLRKNEWNQNDVARSQPIVRGVSAIDPEICEHLIRYGRHARGVRARDSSSSGLAATTARHIARDTATLRRLREKRNLQRARHVLGARRRHRVEDDRRRPAQQRYASVPPLCSAGAFRRKRLAG